MASSPPPSLALLLLLVFSARSRAGADAVECERLDAGRCAFAVSSDGARCVLEIRSGAVEGYACSASEIGAAAFAGLVETDECVAACGLDRRTVGVSSDALLDDGAVRGLCSMECLAGCPNIVNLFSNLAAGEGVYFFEFCASKQEQRNNGRRMVEVRSGGGAMNPAEILLPPAQAPTHI